ncbi:hypothetical protein C10C_0336 [Chlamydia serpentis]|uniref:Uncharacterized protein n=1 Tax=Chlamydia serpentis TaxID=1967782 RepID=A0A2R8FAP9_9CHLA|nr:hypothetical protein [Chlamydia serpentis]SPN73508.1 hypothetical protein C10C_0336 [Chlamydia serpentis]
MSTPPPSINSQLNPTKLESTQQISKSGKEKCQNKTINTIQCLIKVLATILAIEIFAAIIAFFIPGAPGICLIILGGLILATVLCVILLSIKITISKKSQGKLLKEQE